MKCASAADVKGHNCNRFKTSLPKAGTKLREVYDLFQANKGIILDGTLKELGVEHGGVLPLIDYYGLDISHLGHRKWCLVGEWFGSTYIDYLADKVKSKVKK